MELIFGLFALRELIEYYFYKKLSNFISKKKYNFNYNPADSDWFENYIFGLPVPDLKNWLKNTINKNIPNSKNYFNSVDLDNIPKNKIFKWLSYNIYYKSAWQLNNFEINKTNLLLTKLETKLDIKFPDINNPDIYFLKFGNNRLENKYRPVIINNILNVLSDICYLTLYLFDFDKYSYNNIIYLKSENPNLKSWTIFFHGFGFGIQPYLYYILKLRKITNLIIIILPNISNMDYKYYMPNIKYDGLFPEYNTWREFIKFILIKFNISNFNIIGHSFGTIIMGILLNSPELSNKINKKIFLDPVCFFENSYKIFRYINQPNNNGFISKIFNFIIYRDLFLRYITHRFLYGPEFWLYKNFEKLSGNTLVILSEYDQIVPSDNLYNTFKQNNIEVIYIYGAGHSDMFLSQEYSDILNYTFDFLLK